MTESQRFGWDKIKVKIMGLSQTELIREDGVKRELKEKEDIRTRRRERRRKRKGHGLESIEIQGKIRNNR